MASDHPVFAVEIDYLTSVIEPLRDAVSVAEEQRGQMPLTPLFSLAKDGLKDAFTVSGAVDAFLGKWGHGLNVIAKEAEEIADALQVSLTDFQESESRRALAIRQAQREEEAAEQEREDSPVRSWVDEKLGVREARMGRLPAEE